MKKSILLTISIFLSLLVLSCGSQHIHENNNEDQSYFKTINIYKIIDSADKNFRTKDNIVTTFTSMILNASCPNALPDATGAKTITWTSGDITLLGATPTLQIIKNIPCSITLKQYIDLSTPTRIFIPNTAGVYLVLSLNASGSASVVTPVLYAAGATQLYFAGGTPVSVYNIAINYAITPSAASAPVSPATTQSVTFTGGSGAPAPVLSNLNFTKSAVKGNAYYDYSLAGIVTGTGTVSCKYFLSSSISAFDYNTIDTAYSGGAGTVCPTDILSGTQGNLNAYISGASASPYIFIWANLVSGNYAEGYTYLSLGANP